ncbi:MAG: hypothetical protein ABIR02_08195 [Novosphingobium sp.]
MTPATAQDDRTEHAVLMGRRDERDDLIAYLEQRRDNAELMALRSPEFADQARERKRQLSVMIDEFREGHHEGAAMVRAALVRWAGESNTFNQEIDDGSQAAA